MVGGRRPGPDAGALRCRLDAQPHLRRARECRGPVRVDAMVSRRSILLCGVAVAILAGADAARAAELTFDIKAEQGRVSEAMRLIRVTEGDVVTLRWVTDRPLLLHLHGYDIEKRIAPGAMTELTFIAYATGRFPIHVHAPGVGQPHDDTPLATVEVYPQ